MTMFSADELHHIHHYLTDRLVGDIRVHHSNQQPQRVSWFYEDTNYVLEKEAGQYRGYYYHTPQDCKNIDNAKLIAYSKLDNCLADLIRHLKVS